MKMTRYNQHQDNRGGTILVILGVVVVLGITLAAVLSLTTHENRILARTMTWNAALPVAEAGIEEAMSHLRNVNVGPRDVNGWQADGSSFVFSRKLGNGWYAVGISSADCPEIISAGHVWCPSAGREIKRTIQVTTIRRGVFIKGLLAQGKIVMGGSFFTDSFDSLKPELSTNGQYDPAKRSDNGDVGTNLSTPGAIVFGGEAKIYGCVATGPAGTVSMGSKTSVGTENWIDGGNTGIQTNRYSRDMNVYLPAAILPYTNSGATPGGGNIGGISIPPLVVGGTNYKYILEDGVDYRLSTLKLSGSDKMLVRGKARLVVDQDVSLSGDSFIQINTNASLQLYVKQSTVSLSGSGIFNQSGIAANFGLFGLPGVTAINITGDGTFIGTIYAPQAALKMSGGGTDPMDFVGAAIVNTATGSGGCSFHYDESLAYRMPTDLVIVSWQEL